MSMIDALLDATQYTQSPDFSERSHRAKNDSPICDEKRKFLLEMERQLPWSKLVDIVLPRFDKSRLTCAPGTIESLLRQHFLQQWLCMPDVALEREIQGVPQYRDFVKLDAESIHLSRPAFVRGFRLLLKQYELEKEVLESVNLALEPMGLLMAPASRA